MPAPRGSTVLENIYYENNSSAPVGPFGFSTVDMWMYAHILLVAIIFSVDSTFNTVPAIVQTENGRLLGSVELTAIGKQKFHAFRGIRYAKPPIGPLRFRVSVFRTVLCGENHSQWIWIANKKAPEPVEPWDGIQNVTEFGAKCLQTTFNLTQFWGEEDCLFLNVYTPGNFDSIFFNRQEKFLCYCITLSSLTSEWTLYLLAAIVLVV